jgi:ribosomal peptide maturation radical SAM protein 1
MANSTPEPPSINRSLRVALIGMPWFWAHMPSIQLAIVRDLLASCGVKSDVYEFYADFADRFGFDLYGKLANTGTYLAERMFSQFYFDELRSEPLANIPSLAFDDPAIEKHILRFGTPVAEQFLLDCIAETDWSQYDILCFTLTAQQVGASIAFARLLKQHYSTLTIVIGGAGCAGPMGRALLEMCREFDVAVHGEAEATLPALVEALRTGTGLAKVGGISWRGSDGRLCTSEAAPMHVFARSREPLDFSAYFARVQKLANLKGVPSWVPFESSRGCWYGEKSQCTFCGLNEIIKFRQRPTDGIFSELERYESVYGKVNFFAVDLIMPRTFLSDFLPRVQEAAKDWKIFYEVKSNMRRPEVMSLAAAGVEWIQPGIESLSDHVLKLMKKGVSAAQNIQCLRLAKESQIAVSWNIISNFPNETPEDYLEMASFLKHLYHFDPPSGIAPFEVHRFSPFHSEPTEHGIQLGGPHHRYRLVFPVADEVLQNIVYRFEYELIEPADVRLIAARRAVAELVAGWKRASDRQCIFEVAYRDDGSAVLRDNRASGAMRESRCPPHEAKLLAFIEEARPLARLTKLFALAEPEAFALIGGETGLDLLLDRWDEEGTALRLSGVVQCLPTRAATVRANDPVPRNAKLAAAL